MDLHIPHDRFGSRSDPSLNGHLHYPNDIDKSLNQDVDDKIQKYRPDYNHSPPTTVSFMTANASTSGRLHSEFIRLLFLQTHRETDHFCNFRSSVYTIHQWTIPLPSCGVLDHPENKSRKYPHQDCSVTYYTQY
jgi:hypothetical protein